MHNTSSESQLVSALSRGISILHCFKTYQQELSAREIAEMTGLPRPTLFRLLETLRELGLLRYSERVSKYVPGVTLLNFSAPVLARMTIRQLARPYMEDLANYIQGQVQLLVGHRNVLSFTEIVQGQDSKVYRPEVGMRMSISKTASGRAYLCSTTEEARDAYLAAFSPDDPTRKAWLLDRIEDARQDLAAHGFCKGHSDLDRELTTLAVPLSQPRDGEYWIFSTSVPVYSPISQVLTSDIGPRLISLVRNVEASLGAMS